ncbi:hypothetical protein [Streptomyces sp. NBC_00557]|uniref:hypothetical protein n=1 Tax=Streptomyces sp. NBC_00557 TaxID=2975776 RepID=UPI002E821719|nr:hypothetical protein [Streptomyces sp. NBC_00557]WUC35633.1 hypothetical protein OG956_16075 [Streptomyces sp. NBC_00557]
MGSLSDWLPAAFGAVVSARLQAALILKFADATLPDVSSGSVQRGIPAQQPNPEQSAT